MHFMYITIHSYFCIIFNLLLTFMFECHQIQENEIEGVFKVITLGIRINVKLICDVIYE